MKIGIDFTYIKDRPYTGTFQMGFAIYKCFHNYGVSVEAIVSGEKDYKYIKNAGFNARLVKLPAGRVARNILRALYFLANHKRYTDIIYVGSFDPIFFLKKGTLIIHDFYIIDIPHAYDWMQRLYYRFIVLKLIRLSKYCIATTEFNRNRLEQYFPNLCLMPIYSFDHDFKLPSFRYKASGSKSHILLVLTDSPNKRWEELIKQINILSRISPEKYAFHLVSPQKEFFEKIINDSNSNINIRYYKNLDEDYMHNLYQSVDYYWTASIIEGFGIPVRLATLAGVQVIAPDTPINRESSCNLGHYYRLGDGDCHSYITDRLENSRDLKIKKIDYQLAKDEINKINFEFVQSYLNCHFSNQTEKLT